MTESDNVGMLVQLLKKLAVSDIKHPERRPDDVRKAFELLGMVIVQHQHSIDRLEALVKKHEDRIKKLEGEPKPEILFADQR
jgi:hypothetical protein